MNNQEVFEQYGSEKWVIEENLCYLLQEYVEELHNKGYIKESQSPINTVGFVKGFMKENTLCSIEFAEKSKMDNLAKKEVAVINTSQHPDIITGTKPQEENIFLIKGDYSTTIKPMEPPLLIHAEPSLSEQEEEI